nr:hypothetical protein EUGRSUZ_J03146 [Ipomoea batatas]
MNSAANQEVLGGMPGDALVDLKGEDEDSAANLESCAAVQRFLGSICTQRRMKSLNSFEAVGDNCGGSDVEMAVLTAAKSSGNPPPFKGYLPSPRIAQAHVVDVDPLWAHISDRSGGGVACVLEEEFRDPEIRYLNRTLKVDEKIGGIDIEMNNHAAVEIVETRKNLSGHGGEGGFVRDADPVEGAVVHIVEEQLDTSGVLEGEVMAFDDVRVVDVYEYLQLATDMHADSVFVVILLQSIEVASRDVKDLVHLAFHPAASVVVDPLQF